MDTFLNRNFKVRGDINCLFATGKTSITQNIANIEVQLWHKSPMQVALLGKSMTNSDGEFIIEFEIDSPVDYIVDGKISDTFLEAYYNGEKLDIIDPLNLWTGLVAYWKLDELSGTSAEDLTGNGHTGTLSGTTLPSWDNGKINNGLYINGGSSGTNESYLSVPTSSDFNFDTGDFTYAFWVKPNDVSFAYCVIDTGFYNADSFLIQFYDYNTINIMISGTLIYTGAYRIMAGNWYHLVARRIDGQLDICINGVSLGSISFTGIVSEVSGLAIGSYIWGVQTLDGVMDEVGVWKGHGLTDDEVKILYNSGHGLTYQP